MYIGIVLDICVKRLEKVARVSAAGAENIAPLLQELWDHKTQTSWVWVLLQIAQLFHLRQ